MYKIQPQEREVNKNHIFDKMRSIYLPILEQIRLGSRIVLATVVHAEGSTPQKPGSSALFGESGLLAGTVGGGIMEGEVHHIADSIMISGLSDYFYFNLNNEPSSDGAICGGEAGVLVDADPSMHIAALEAMETSLSNRVDGMLLTVVSQKNENGRTIRRYWIDRSSPEDLPVGMDPVFKELVKAHLKLAVKDGFSQIDLNSIPDQQVKMAFLEHIRPLPHLIIVGGGHVGKALAHLGSLLEFEVSVVDDRPEYASREHIPDADQLMVGEPGKALQGLQAGPDTYIVIVTRGHTHDGEALKACIRSNAAYIGMIGSRRKVGLLKKQFLEEKWASPEQWAAIHAPIGLAIGSQTVQEIAISIAAQLVDVRRNKNESHGK
jgi:xanthine dehydrogenase accessory factor